MAIQVVLHVFLVCFPPKADGRFAPSSAKAMAGKRKNKASVDRCKASRNIIDLNQY